MARFRLSFAISRDPWGRESERTDFAGYEDKPRRRRRWRTLVILGVIAIVPLALVAGTGHVYAPLGPGPTPPGSTDLARLRKDNTKLRADLQRKVPTTNYIVVDKLNNRLQLKRGDKIVREAICSCGSGMVLRESEGGKREWFFDTPRGQFKVRQKVENPVWRKPDWAFVEEGKPIPRNSDERIEYGMMGEYGLHFGDGYLIHGTLYERLLGRNVTHGCVRLGREDLREIYRAADLGTPVFVY
jgi:hypothetical protein